MKTLTIIPIILTSLVSNPNKATIPAFDSIMISPFYLNKMSQIVVTTRSSYLKFTVYINNDKFTEKAILTKEITEPGTYSYNYNNTYTRSKNEIFVRYTTGTTYIDTISADRNVVRSTYRNLENNEGFSSSNAIVDYRSYLTYIERKIQYSFGGFEGLYVPSYFHKINLYDFKIFIADQYKPFFNVVPTLVIQNYNGAFDTLGESGESVVFNLKLVERTDGYTFTLDGDYFVSTETLQMYKKRQSLETPKTRHIYFPVNEMRNEDKYKCYFQFSEFGIDKDLVIHHFDIKALRNIFGDCHNSKYCIAREQV